MPRVDTAYGALRNRRRVETAAALTALFADMKDDVLARWSAGAKRLVSARWDKALAAVMLDENMLTAAEVARRVADALGAEFDPGVMAGWLDANTAAVSAAVNAHTEDDIHAADSNDDVDEPVDHVFGILATTGAFGIAQQMVTTSAGFGARDAARSAGAAAKVWKVNSGNPRSSHASMNGEAVGMDDAFSNGMNWPGDPSGGAEENANCQCSITIVR